jgi:predicted small secreted protein
MIAEALRGGIKALVLLAILGLSAMACNTMEGAGKDIQEAGDEIEDAAD